MKMLANGTLERVDCHIKAVIDTSKAGCHLDAHNQQHDAKSHRSDIVTKGMLSDYSVASTVA